jgi:hypothetical protein
MMETVGTSETSVDNHFTWQYIPEDNSEHHTSRRENLKSHKNHVIVAQSISIPETSKLTCPKYWESDKFSQYRF